MYEGDHIIMLDTDLTIHNGTDSRTLDSEIYDSPISTMVPGTESDQMLGLCTGCGTRILDRYLLLVAGQQWHVTCLRCSECQVQLDSQVTCFVRDGLVFCKQDYYRRYSLRRCSRCHVGLSSLELVMRSRDFFYHVDCFTCFSCNKPLLPGDTYGIHEDQIFCQEDYEHLLNNSQIVTSYCHVYDYSYPDLDAPHEYLGYCTSGYEHKGSIRKRRHMMPGDGCFQNLGLMTNKHGDLIPRDKYIGQPTRQKRVRTSFKHTQLRTMKSYFAMNHNPDAKDLKDLAKKTQLSKRVLQVWFQNARAKFRRSAAKQNAENPEASANAEQNETEQLLDLSKCGSPALSDISTSQSLASTDAVDNQSKFSDSIHESYSDGNASP